MPRPRTKPNRVIQPFSRHIHAIVVGRQAQIYERMFRLEVRQPRQQPAHRERPHRADRQHLAKMSALESLERLRDMVERLAQHRQQGFAFAGQHQPAGQAFEQGDAELSLKAFDLMAHRRLRDTQLHGRPGETQMPRGGLEGAQCIER